MTNSRKKRMRDTQKEAKPAATEMKKLTLTYDDLTELFGWSHQTISRRVKAKKMPMPIRMSHKTVFWPRAVIESWVAQGCVSVRSLKK